MQNPTLKIVEFHGTHEPHANRASGNTHCFNVLYKLYSRKNRETGSDKMEEGGNDLG